MSRRGAASIVASPVLVGAVTVLVTVVAVVLAYNANQGLPFVPTYTLNATVPGAANLVEGNEVRIGGFRVGLIDRIAPAIQPDGRGTPKAVAILRMRLDKTVEELPRDTTLIVRPRSALGLKYLELTPGSSAQTWKPGSFIPLAKAQGPVEFDDFLNTFQEQPRDDAQRAQEGFGDAFAGRGQSINEAISELRPLFEHLSPVMRSLSNPDTKLIDFFDEIGQTAAQLARSCDDGSGPRRLPAGASLRSPDALSAQTPSCSQPVAMVQARVFSEMADTFAAIGRDEAALREFIEKGPPFNRQVPVDLRRQKPFLRDFTALSVRLRPAVNELPRSLPDLNDALIAAQPVLPRTVAFNERTEDVLKALEDLTKDPSTLVGLKDITELLQVGAPLLEYLAPYQTVCNYWNSGWTNLGGHLDEPVASGNIQRVLVKTDNNTQDDRYSDSNGDRPVDVPADEDPQEANNTEQLQDAIDELQDQIDELQDAVTAIGNGDLDAEIPERFRDQVPGEPSSLGDALTDLGVPFVNPLPDVIPDPVQDVIDAIVAALNEIIDRLQDILDELIDQAGQPLEAFHGQSYTPAIDGQGNADCQMGQIGYLDRLVTTGRYKPSNDPEESGGSHVVVDSDTPGLAGPTYKGVPNLRDVDREQRSRHPDGEVPDKDKVQRPNTGDDEPGSGAP